MERNVGSTVRMPRRQGRRSRPSASGRVFGVVAGLIACATLADSPATALQWQPFEISVATREAGRLRSLAERLSKQNAMYQLELGEIEKRDMHFPVNEIDRILDQLNRGSAYYSVAGPLNNDARLQLAEIEASWVSVRRLALASPYDYLRRTQEFVPPDNPRGDPKSLVRFDRMTARFIIEVEALMGLYHAECAKTTYPLCEISRQAGHPTMLGERLMKSVVFVHRGLDTERQIESLEETIRIFDENYLKMHETALYKAATDPSRGAAGKAIATLRERIEEHWRALRSEALLAVAGRADEIDLVTMIHTHREFIHDFERYIAIVGRFAAGGFSQSRPDPGAPTTSP